MQNDIVYVELKTDYSDDGPAWIGRASYSKSRRTIYFNGKAFFSLGGSGTIGNYRDIETNEQYWISGVKKNQEDRHWAGSGKISIDKDEVENYLALVGLSSLDPKRFETTTLDNDFEKVKARIYKSENCKLKK